MLADKLRAATAAAAVPIEYVGGYVEGFAGQTTNKTISLTSLTGGLASAPAAGDLVIVYFGTGSTTDYNLVVAGYKEITELYSGDIYDTNLVVAYKVMGSTPDTSLVLTGGTLSASDAGAVAVQVWRNVDPYGPLDVSAVTAVGASSARSNPPSITPITKGSIVVSGGAGAHAGGTLTFTSSDLSGFITIGSNDANDVTVGLGYYEWTSGAFDPAQFGLSGSDSINNSWAAVTLALRPAPQNTPEFVGVAASESSYERYIDVATPAGTVSGDLMVAFLAIEGDSVRWFPPSGWTEAVDAGTSPSIAVAYRFAPSTPAATYRFTSNDNSLAQYGAMVTFRNAAVDVIGSVTTAAAGNININISGITPSVAGVLLTFCATDDNRGVTPQFDAYELYNSSDGRLLLIENITAAATGTRDFRVESGEPSQGVMLSIVST